MKARKSFGMAYDCLKPWPENCFVQCGGDGLVIASKGSLNKVFTSEDPLKELAVQASHPESYITAFFEAFPKEPDTFIRGEGKDIAAAEEDAWTQYLSFVACKGHEFEKRGYTNGAGFCVHCGMFKSKAFVPEDISK